MLSMDGKTLGIFLEVATEATWKQSGHTTLQVTLATTECMRFPTWKELYTSTADSESQHVDQ
jgi:hypothetical protein